MRAVVVGGVSSDPRRSWQGFAKLLVDRIGGAILLVIAAPLLLACVALVRITSPGPALFRQRRIGHRGREFTMFKLRTMQMDADARLAELLRDPEAAAEWRAFGRLRDDPRLTPPGRFLRQSSLDELPQLLNVVIGDMSLVGPRPLEAGYAAPLPAAERAAREAVLPGMTGLWQVSGRSDLDIAAIGRIDSEYVRSWSLWSDIVILLRTPAAVLGRRGAY